MATPDSDLKQWHGGMPKIAVKFTRIAAAALCSVQLNEVQVWSAVQIICGWKPDRGIEFRRLGSKSTRRKVSLTQNQPEQLFRLRVALGKKNTGLFGNFPSIRPNPVPLWYRFERSYHSMVIWNRPRQVNGNGWNWLNVDERAPFKGDASG